MSEKTAEYSMKKRYESETGNDCLYWAGCKPCFKTLINRDCLSLSACVILLLFF